MWASKLIEIFSIILLTGTSTVLSRYGTQVCCRHGPLVSKYTGKGTTVKLGDMEVYETVDKSPKRVMILAYDIFGMTENPKQLADILGNCGYRVVIPDFFRGTGYDPTNFPPKDFNEVKQFGLDHGPWDTRVKPDLVSVIAHYKGQGATSFGIFGFCFGGRVSTLASIELSADIKVAGLIHPYLVELIHASEVNTPILLVPSKTEVDMLPFAEKVNERLGKNACLHVRFQDMVHGFAGARTDFTNALNVKRVGEVIDLIFKFFNQHMPK